MDTFMEELGESVESFNREFLILEASESREEREQAIRRALRVAHTLKGTARVVHAAAIEDACHIVEEVLLHVRNDGVRPDTSLMQLLFATTDAILESGPHLDDDDPSDLASLIGSLQMWIAGHPPPPPPLRRASLDTPRLDALLVTLHRDLGRWLAARRRLPPCTESEAFLEPFQGLAERLGTLSTIIDQSIYRMAEAPLSPPPPPPPSPPTSPSDLASALPAIDATSRVPAIRNHTAYILVVDDSATMRTLQRATLEEAGYRVLSAENGQRGLEIFQHEHVDLVVLDVEMPIMDGFALARAIRNTSHGADVPMIMVSGLSTSKDKVRAARLGVNHYIVKSLAGHREMVSVVSSLLAEPRGG